MHKKVLVCLPLNDAHRTALEASVPEFEFRFNALDDVHAEDVLWADIVLGNAPVSMIRQNKHIEWFQSNSAGPDAYLKPGVLPENCMVTNATGAYGLAISEWMLAMWLGIQKDMFLYRDRQNQRQWAPIDRPVRGITGARVLCVGMGDIGSNFARRAHMLGAEVVGVRRTVHPDTPCPDYCLRVVAQSQLDEELPEADLIALSLPGTPETNKLFNAERFARCKDGAILINVGRGTTVDSDALVEALRSGKIFGAGLDVTDPEPLPADHPLWGEPGAIITPHNSGKFSLPKTLDNIVDMYSCEAPMQYIGQQMQTTKAIRARLDKLTSQSVEYIMESLSNTTQPIKNIRAYLRTVILNAPGTMESYYQVQANAAVAASSHPPAPAGSLMAGAVRHFGQKRRDGT